MSKTGNLTWVFHTVPLPGEYGHETWDKDSYKKIGGANCRAGMVVDEKKGGAEQDLHRLIFMAVQETAKAFSPTVSLRSTPKQARESGIFKRFIMKYIAIAAGGARYGLKADGTYVAFALP